MQTAVAPLAGEWGPHRSEQREKKKATTVCVARTAVAARSSPFYHLERYLAFTLFVMKCVYTSRWLSFLKAYGRESSIFVVLVF